LELGLSSYWEELLGILSKIVPFYERANELMTFFTLKKMRKSAAYLLRARGGAVLDAGCGPGVMFEYAVEASKAITFYVCLDPLKEMLTAASGASDSRMERVRGVFEHLPFREGGFSACIAAFSFRDARSYPRAMRSLSLSLKKGGILVVLDLYKSGHRLGDALRQAYFSLVPRMVGLIYMGLAGAKLYAGLRETFRRFISQSTMERLARKAGFRRVHTRPIYGMAVVMAAVK